jgi:tRNA(Ile)-lysidine synthase
LDDCINDLRSARVNRRPVLERKVERFLRRREIGAGGMVVAVSGGPDSVALLRAILSVRRPNAGERMIVAHLNHRLRGDESERDAAFVCELHARLAATHPYLELRCDAMNVAELAQAERGNLEAVARRLRYHWLAAAAQEAGVHWVATGHTADDQAETVLHRLLRGAGLQGLRGIAAHRSLTSDVALIRPLLTVMRAEVMAYLEAKGQAYREDSSNRSLALTRNRLRHELLPHLSRYNPAIAAVLCRLAGQADEAYRAVEAEARALLAEAEQPRAGSLLIFDRQRLFAEPRRLVCEMFRLVWAREGWPTGHMSFAAWERLGEVAQGKSPGVDLPGGVRALCRERVVQLGPAS